MNKKLVVVLPTLSEVLGCRRTPQKPTVGHAPKSGIEIKDRSTTQLK